jgi:DNA-binding transcriptional ArsR family regulator
VNGDADVAAVAALIGDPARASLLLALADSKRLPARDLAHRAGIAPSTASGHLAKLASAKLVVGEREGRHRFFRLADPSVAEALEALATIAPTRPVSSLREANAADAIRRGRMCYDHLAGRLGVELTAALEREGVLTYRDDSYALGPAGRTRLGAFGLDLGALANGRRPLVRTCLDWSERRPHLAGALGAALAARLFELGWLKRRPSTRSVEVTPRGQEGLRAEFGIDQKATH